jgi:hypothetical protein
LVKFFRWGEDTRDLVLLGPNVRINPDTSRAQLVADADGFYPTAANLFTRSRITDPSTVRGWVGFDARAIHYEDEQGTQVTSIAFRLHNGTSEFWWNGAAWAAPGANDWNTEAEVADNIASFNHRQLAVVANLSTTDRRFTPELIEVRVAWRSDIEFQEDIIHRSFVRALRAGIRPIGRAELVVPAGGATTFTLAQLGLETGYDVVDVDSVFNVTADPDLQTDIFLSYNAGTQTVTMTASQAAGNRLRVNFIYRPAITVRAHQDGSSNPARPTIVEHERLPVVLLQVPALSNANERAGEDVVVNKSSGAAIVVPAPVQGDLNITIRTICEKDVDNQRLSDQLKSFFINTPLLKSTGLDEKYRIWLVDKFATVGEPSQEGLFEQEATVRISGVCYWLRSDFDEQATTRLVVRVAGEQNPIYVEE